MRGLAIAAAALLAAAAPTAAPAEEALVYTLCAGRIAGADVTPPEREGGAFAVTIDLLPEASEALAELTAAHEGELLEIDVGRGHVVRGRIGAPIRTGRIATGGYARREEAEAVRDAALASRARACPSDEEAAAAP